MRTGIYGGTFSPPHNGHIAAATAFSKQMELDELLIIPSFIPPHKAIDENDDPKKRLEMCRIAFSDIKKVKVSDIELLRGGKSYTSDTLEALSASGRELFLLCGTDMILTLDEWHCPERIFEMSTPVLIRRESDDRISNELSQKLSEYEKKYNVKIPSVKAPVIEISSSEIRAAIKQGIDISDYLKPELIEYIDKNGLYKI